MKLDKKDYDLLPPLPSIKDLNTLQDFQNLIDTRGYLCPLEFMIDFGSGYKKLGELKLKDKVVYPQNSKYQEYSNLSLEEVQKIIDDREEHIGSLYQLGCVVSKFLVTYIKDMGWEDKLVYNTRTTESNYTSIKTLDDFQKHIDRKGYRSSTDFKNHEGYLYNKMGSLGFCSKVLYTTPYGYKGTSKEIFKYGEYFGLSVNEIQQIITDNEIYSLSQLGKYYSHRLWRYIVDNKLGEELKFISFRGTHDYHQWKRLPEIDNLEKTQKLIDDNKINSKGEFKGKFSVVYNRAVKNGYIDDLVFGTIPSPASIEGFGSSWEMNLFKFLESTLDLTKFSLKHNVPAGCVDIKSLEFDIEIYSIIKNCYIYIEVQGPTHFYESLENSDLDYTRRHDIMKNDWVKKDPSKNLLYFCYDRSLVDTYDYPFEVITDEQVLLGEILKLIEDGNRE